MYILCTKKIYNVMFALKYCYCSKWRAIRKKRDNGFSYYIPDGAWNQICTLGLEPQWITFQLHIIKQEHQSFTFQRNEQFHHWFMDTNLGKYWILFHYIFVFTCWFKCSFSFVIGALTKFLFWSSWSWL